MREGTFDLTSFEKAIYKLNEILIRYEQNSLDDAIRDSVTQRFEYTYSLALKTLKG